MRVRRSLPALLTAALLALPVTALAADSTGTRGAVDSVEVFSPSASTFLKYHGRIFVLSGSKKQEYRWGGTSCGNKTIDTQMVDLLYRAMSSSKIEITPSYKSGQGKTRCLVGFKLKKSKRTPPRPT